VQIQELLVTNASLRQLIKDERNTMADKIVLLHNTNRDLKSELHTAQLKLRVIDDARQRGSQGNWDMIWESHDKFDLSQTLSDKVTAVAERIVEITHKQVTVVADPQGSTTPKLCPSGPNT
jgi:hypothetical protein